MPKRVIDITGKKWGKLTAVSFVEVSKGAQWIFRCDCGKTKKIPARSVKYGSIISCGCVGLITRFQKGRTTHNKSHGLTGSRFWGIFQNIKTRCNNPKCVYYPYYGGRGIKCHWSSFDDFKKDMYESYLEHVEKHGQRQTTIDRFPNQDGPYSKENCRWATLQEQQRNKRGNVLYQYKEKQMFLQDIGDEIGIKWKTLWRRINDSGWPIEKALTTPVRSGRKTT